MIPFIICTCGRSIGDLYDAFAYMRHQAYIAAYGKQRMRLDPSMAAIMRGDNINLSDVFDDLGISADMQCCRGKLAFNVRFQDMV